jgi:hypothetical protein
MRMTTMTPGRQILVAVVTMLALTMFSGAAHSQVDQGTSRSSTTNYHFAEPNELTITVSVLGSVRSPGRYEISRTIDLLNLLAVAGGTSENADLGDVRLYRILDVGGRVERRELRIDLKNLSEFQAEPFELQQGDLVFVGRSGALTVPEVLSILSTVTATTLAIIAIVQITGPGGRR